MATTAKRHLAPRAIGDMAIHLRNEQNIFQVDYLINAISNQMATIDAQQHREKEKHPHSQGKQGNGEPVIDECILSSLSRINQANFDLNTHSWKQLKNWTYANVDLFRFTHLAANLSKLRHHGELKRISELVALYAYLLSYKLEQILFVPRQEEDNLDNDIAEAACGATDFAPPASPSFLSDNDSAPSLACEPLPETPHGQQAIKRKRDGRDGSEGEEEDRPPWQKRKRLDDTPISSLSDEEMPMIIADDDEPTSAGRPTYSQTTGITPHHFSTPLKRRRKLPLSHADYLHKPNARQRKQKSYTKLYRTKQRNTLRMFYKNKAITNLGDILQGVRFEKRRKANNVASYEKTLRRLQGHLLKLQRQKKPD